MSEFSPSFGFRPVKIPGKILYNLKYIEIHITALNYLYFISFMGHCVSLAILDSCLDNLGIKFDSKVNHFIYNSIFNNHK